VALGHIAREHPEGMAFPVPLEELPQQQAVPAAPMVQESLPQFEAVPAACVALAYSRSVEGHETGQFYASSDSCWTTRARARWDPLSVLVPFKA
jgi:hypothetical protein